MVAGTLGKAIPWQQLGRKIFGETIPDTVQPVLKELSPKTAFTFSQAIDFDSTVREGLDTLMHSAGSGNDDAFMLMEYAARDFAKEDATYRNLNAASKNLAKQQRANWHAMDQRIQDAPTATGATGRKATASVAQLGRQEAPKPLINRLGKEARMPLGMQAATKQADPADYAVHSVHSGRRSPLKENPITQLHHPGGLDDLSWIFRHQSYQGVTPNSGHPLIEMGDKLFGIQIGNSVQNASDVLGWMTKRGRQARVLALSEQVGDVMHSKTIDDLLGTSDFRPHDIPQEGLEELRAIRSSDPAFKDMSVEEYTQIAKNPVTGKAYPKGGVSTKIEIWDPKANISKNSPDKPLEVIKLDESTFENRVQLAFDAYQKHGIDVTEARKKWDKKLAKIDPNEDILGVDHPLVHEFINALKKQEGTALYKLEKMSDDEIFNLPMEEAFRLYVRQMQEMETVLANVLQYRYEKVKEIFKEFNPKKNFEKLDATEKQLFFRKNVNTIAVRGNIEQDISLKASLKPIKGWNNHISDVFGWQPQSLWVTIEEIEELAKEFAAKVPTTQPIPGVV